MDELTVEDFFKYYPSTVLAAAALALFLLATAIVIFQTERSRWRYLQTVSLTGLVEAAGYACILACIMESGTANLFGPYVAKQLFLLLSPNLLQGTAYVAVGHVLASSPDIARGRCPLGKKAVTALSVGTDLFARIVQGSGMSIYATAITSGTGTVPRVR